jgi:hypothetical protein
VFLAKKRISVTSKQVSKNVRARLNRVADKAGKESVRQGARIKFYFVEFALLKGKKSV